MMKYLFIFFIIAHTGVFAQLPGKAPADKFILVIHGGAGSVKKGQVSAEMEKAYAAGLEQALVAGYTILKKGGSSLDAVEAAVKILEDNPLFNAGRGAVFNNEGIVELDAAVMNGKTQEAGAVTGVTTIKNPVSAARAVMEKSVHVMMAGKGAENFAAGAGIELVDPFYFFTETRWKNLQKSKATDSVNKKQHKGTKSSEGKTGTVGAVALDRSGNLAAATSTGGMLNKKPGRVGDAPVIGAGTYANNSTCAISCTGWGEYYIRLVLAKTVSDMMEFGKMTLEQAAAEMVWKRLPALGGDGGLIAIDANGNFTMPFNTPGMFRGVIKADGKAVIKMYKESD
jgi:beta-aspartyl-peptidase (threonine type)